MSPTQLIMLQGCSPYWLLWETSAAGNFVEGPVDGCRRLRYVTLTELITLRLHSVNTSRRPRLPAYIKDTSPVTHVPALWWRTSLPADWTLSYSPTVVALLLTAALSVQCSDNGECWLEAPIGRILAVPPPVPSVSSACALNSPIWAYIIAVWSP